MQTRQYGYLSTIAIRESRLHMMGLRSSAKSTWERARYTPPGMLLLIPCLKLVRNPKRFKRSWAIQACRLQGGIWLLSAAPGMPTQVNWLLCLGLMRMRACMLLLKDAPLFLVGTPH